MGILSFLFGKEIEKVVKNLEGSKEEDIEKMEEMQTNSSQDLPSKLDSEPVSDIESPLEDDKKIENNITESESAIEVKHAIEKEKEKIISEETPFEEGLGQRERKSIAIPEGDQEIPSYAFYSNQDIYVVTLSSTLYKIGESASEGCGKLEIINFLASLKTIGKQAFSNCQSLSKVDLSDCIRLTEIGKNMFLGCDKLEIVIFPASLKSIANYAFNGCQSLSSVDFSNCTELTEIGKNTFNRCKNLKTIDLSKCTKLEALETNAFDGCENLNTIVMPAGLKEIHAPLCICLEQLSKVDFSRVMHLRTIPSHLFGFGCDKLIVLTIPNGVTEIEDEAFDDLDYLKTILLPPSLTIVGEFNHSCVDIYCFSPELEELEPLVHGCDYDDIEDYDDNDDIEDCDDDDNYDDVECDEDASDDNNEDNEELEKDSMISGINLYVLPQFVDNYINQRNVEGIPEKILNIQEIPEKFRCYYEND